LLDAGLLSEVYVRMTRGQDSLVIDSGETAGDTTDVTAIDLSLFTLAAVVVSADEQRAHDAVLADLDKACGGRTLWRRLA